MAPADQLVSSEHGAADDMEGKNYPDMPVLQACDLGEASAFNKLVDVPKPVSAEIARFFGASGISEVDRRFDSIDVVGGPAPQRRFLCAYQSGNYWIIWFEVGGIAGGPRTIALFRDADSQASGTTFKEWPGTIFGGDLCAASKAR
ncbi:hypothetical protein [Sphingobium terrigena]|uniref:hypothetical protein n=1 Tax=Sphingobium terrigena TaxID=2304063 RepID=UPI001602A956|nr:hypothetical protein [Sphingobium terrigena]